MPTDVGQFPLWRLVEGFERALKSINQADGFNTSPKVVIGSRTMNEVADGEYPFVGFELGDLQPGDESLGGQASRGLIRFAWPAFVYGYVKASGGRRDLYKSGSALLADVIAAVYADETLPDAAGQGSALMVEPGPVAFDMESFSSTGRGFFVATFELVADVERSGTP